MFVGLREFLDRVDRLGELETVTGAHWDREMSTIAYVASRERPEPAPALLFDEIPDYPTGYRTVYSATNSLNRFALSVGLDPTYDDEMHLLRDFRKKQRTLESRDGIPPQFVGAGAAPVLENTDQGDDVDLLTFPVPLHHDHDGGRYIGTMNCVVTRDPSTGRVNVGTYRSQVQDHQEATIYISPGKRGYLHVTEYFEADEPAPVAMSVGQDPTLWLFSGMGITDESTFSEYDRAGALKDEAFSVVEGPITGLPVPANAEIVLEGYLRPDETRVEGPFGEWAGYYASGRSEEPLFDVEAVHYRDDPIIGCAVPNKPPHDYSLHKAINLSANLWEQIDHVGVPGVTGVWSHEAGGSRLFDVVAIDQKFDGHARWAAHVAAQTRQAAYAGRWTIVVDDDVNPADMDDVVFAMSTRCDPVAMNDIETMDRCWSTPLDPMIDSREEGGPTINSRVIVDATVPYERRNDFPRVSAPPPDYEAQIRTEWRHVVTGSG